jgi:peptide/nickel transport system ATP-binding protein
MSCRTRPPGRCRSSPSWSVGRPATRNQIINLLEDQQTELGLAYVFIAHDLALVRHIARRVAVMHAGRIVEEGPTEHVFRDPTHPYTGALLAASPVADPKVERARRESRRSANPLGS